MHPLFVPEPLKTQRNFCLPAARLIGSACEMLHPAPQHIRSIFPAGIGRFGGAAAPLALN
jgi:hypothetical protein